MTPPTKPVRTSRARRVRRWEAAYGGGDSGCATATDGACPLVMLTLTAKTAPERLAVALLQAEASSWRFPPGRLRGRGAVEQLATPQELVLVDLAAGIAFREDPVRSRRRCAAGPA